MSDSFMPKSALEKLAKRYGLGEYAREPVPKVSAPGTGLYRDGDAFIFEDLEVGPGQYLTVRLNDTLLDNRRTKSQEEWWDYSMMSSDEVLPNGIVLYEMMRRLYVLRNDLAMQDTIDRVRGMMGGDWGNMKRHTGTRISYRKTDVIVEHLQLDGTAISHVLQIPAKRICRLGWWPLRAKAQPRHESVEPSYDDAVSFVEALLGPHAAEAERVFQYVAPLEGGLRPVYFSTVGTNKTGPDSLLFGYDPTSTVFGIRADESADYLRPARGVTVLGSRGGQ